jgi:hypothetical protein
MRGFDPENCFSRAPLFPENDRKWRISIRRGEPA